MNYAFLGAGKMAMAIILGMLRSKLCPPTAITVSSRSPEGLQNLSTAASVRTATSNADAIAKADVVVLCMKPADLPKALEPLVGSFSGKLIISVAAGIPIEKLAAMSGHDRIIRAMPNTAAMVGRSATALAGSAAASREDYAAAEDIFGAVGKVFTVPEGQIDAITGLSGSGPAFIYLILEALSDGGVAVGLPRKLALELAVETLAGAAEMVNSTAEHPAVLREMVTSPNGTTIAGLAELEKAAVRAAVANAVKAAAHRAQELSR